MWSEACDMLARAERLQRQFAQLRRERPVPVWEPPADVLETAQEVLVLLALPGVDPEKAVAVIEDGMLLVVGDRVLPPQLRTATIHRLELPQGRFERRLPLPGGRYDKVSRSAANGCLVITLRKA
ncbi:MAG TPA: Hsp20/alpha crystallin family protein [Propylenella sp.]